MACRSLTKRRRINVADQPTDALAPTERTQFDYLLNALEAASQSDKPAEHGYGDKRKALYAYVRDLERQASLAQEAPAPAMPTDGYEKMRGGKPVSFWRDDALEQAAQIAERYSADPWAARDIRAMKSALPAAPEQQPT